MAHLFNESAWNALVQLIEKSASASRTIETKLTIIAGDMVDMEIFDSMKLKLQEFPSLRDAVQVIPIGQYITDIQNNITERPEEHEVFDQPDIALSNPEMRKRIIVYSPSVRLLEQLRAKNISLHDLHWRQFEEIVAELLSRNGYTVKLGRGTKDDGKDIVAIKEEPGCGFIMSVWQAKKIDAKNKVGIHVIRELADTRDQMNASKGVIVTTTSLTKGALKRIERERYLLHKVDGDDLQTWIQKTP